MTRLQPLLATLALLLLAALLARPLLHGVAAPTILGFWATVLGQVVVPGVALVRGARLVPTNDRSLLLAQGTALGLALHGLSFLAGRALGLPWLPLLVALGTTLLGLDMARRARPDALAAATGAGSEGPLATVAMLSVALCAVLLLPLTSAERPCDPVPFDLLFHGGVAAELRHRWPLEDPRVAGVPLHYHLLAYALPVAAADVTSAPVADTLFTLAPLLWLMLLALQLRSAGHALFGDARVGVLGAALVMSHTDPGRLLGLGPGAFNSFFATGVYGSPTTLCSFVLLCAFALSLHAWIDRDERRQLVTLGLLAAALSAAKTTVLPVVLAALALSALASRWRKRAHEARRFGAALAVSTLAAAPLTIWQNAGAESYSTMAGLGFAAAFSSSGIAAWWARAAGPGVVSSLLAVPAFVVWLVGYLGLSGVAAAVGLRRQCRGPSGVQTWAIFVMATGLAASLVVSAPGLSQLFLLYNGQLLLALFAGAGFVAAWRRPHGLREWVVPALLALATLPTVVHLAVALAGTVRRDVAAAAYVPQPSERDYAVGLAWLRSQASRRAVVWADNPSMLLSALGEVRLFYENGTYSARAWRVGEGREPWPERVALQERLLRRPDRDALAEARRAMDPRSRLLVVADSVQSSVIHGIVGPSVGAVPRRRLFPEALFELRFVNGAMQVYEAREAERRP